jgi:DNA anti-recombination protein RmuC
MSRFEKVVSQSRKGIRSQERLARLLDDVATLLDSFSANLSRLVTAGITDIDTTVGGQRDGFHEVSRSLLLALKQLIFFGTSASQTASSFRTLSRSAQETSKNDIKGLRQVEQQELALRKQLESVCTSFEKTKKQCEKSIAPLFDAGFEASKVKRQERLSSKAAPKVLQYFTNLNEANRCLTS